MIIANELLCGSRRSFKRGSDYMTGDLDAFSGADNKNQVVTCSALWISDRPDPPSDVWTSSLLRGLGAVASRRTDDMPRRAAAA